MSGKQIFTLHGMNGLRRKHFEKKISKSNHEVQRKLERRKKWAVPVAAAEILLILLLMLPMAVFLRFLIMLFL